MNNKQDKASRIMTTEEEKDKAFKAATHDVDVAKATSPGPAFQKSESTGRPADDSWKNKTSQQKS